MLTQGPDGKPLTVHYSMLTSMLLNELQKQAAELKEQARDNVRQSLGALRAQVAAMSQRLSAIEQAMLTRSADGKLAAEELDP